MVNKSILFVGYSLQKTYFFEKHCEYLHQNYMCEVEIICLDTDYGASRSGIKDILVLFFKIFFKVRKINPDLIVSITPKAGLLCGLLSVFLQRVTFVTFLMLLKFFFPLGRLIAAQTKESFLQLLNLIGQLRT